MAKLFAGIFVCIVPVIAMLQAGEEGALAPLVRAGHAADGSAEQRGLFLADGRLSSFLDNAPTYLVFFELAGGDPKALMTPRRADARGDLVRRGVHGRQHLYRQCAELHGLCHRPRRRQNAVLFWLYAVVGAILIPIFLLVTLLFF